MKKIIFLLCVFSLINCQGQIKETKRSGVETELKSQSIFDELKELLLRQAKSENVNFTVEVFENENYVNLDRKLDGANYGGFYFSKKDEDQFTGDLNSDGVKDIIVKVESNSGGNSSYTDYYLFLSKDGKYELSNPEGWDIPSGCKDEPYGRFVLTKIENGKLVGESMCLKEEDPRCCPSVIYTTVFKVSNGNLEWVSTQFKEKRNIEYYRAN